LKVNCLCWNCLSTKYVHLVKTYNGDAINLFLNQDICREIKTLFNETGGTLFMGLLTVVNIFIHRYTGQEISLSAVP